LEKDSGATHANTYTVRLDLAEKHYIGTDRTMKLAQCAAARLALADQQRLSPMRRPKPAAMSSPIRGNHLQ
jgi:hypothetical protein